MPPRRLLDLGHPGDQYEVAALLNLQDGRIGDVGIDSLEQVAELDAEVFERTNQAIIVNADDPLCLAVPSPAQTTRHILVTSNADNPAVGEHRRRGGDAVFIDRHDNTPWIVVATGDARTPLIPVHEISGPVNAFFAAAMAWAQRVPLPSIRQALASFADSPYQDQGALQPHNSRLPLTLVIFRIRHKRPTSLGVSGAIASARAA